MTTAQTRQVANQLTRWQRSVQPAQLRFATVTAISASAGTLTVTFAGSSNPVAGVPYLVSYTPTVNDVVELLQSGSDLVAIGSITAQPWTSYTVSWTSSGTQPSIGNGSLIGRYVLRGKMCTVRIALKGGSTTTVGTGGYTFSLPFTSATTAGEQVFAGELFDGANHYASYGLIGDGGGGFVNPFSLKGGTGGTAPQMSGGNAFAAGLPAFITIQGTYEIA